MNVDTGRFPKTDGGYESPDYETAANKADIEIDGGMASVQVA